MSKNKLLQIIKEEIKSLDKDCFNALQYCADLMKEQREPEDILKHIQDADNSYKLASFLRKLVKEAYPDKK